MSVKGESLGTVQRVFEVLRHLAETGETTVTNASVSLGLVPSTTHRMLDLLVQDGLAERDPVKRSYSVGAEFFRLASLILARQDVRSLARRYLQQVVDECDETCVLCLYSPQDGHAIYAEKVDSSQFLRYQLPMNTPLPILWGASGRAILAYLPSPDVDRIHSNGGRSPGSGARLPSKRQLHAELELIRARGYAISFGQKIPGAVGINAPVFNARNEVIGSLGVTVPEQRITPADEAKLSKLVRKFASRLSAALGATRTPDNAEEGTS